MLRQLFREPAFIYGLAIRLAAVCLLASEIQQDWFVAFVSNTFGRWPDPWTIHMAAGGDPLAFPYGPVMYLFLAPLTALGAVIDKLASTGMLFAGLAFRISLLIADFALLMILRHQFPERREVVTALYWLSPVLLFVTYWHGQLDVIPVLFFVASVALIRSGNMAAAGAALGLSIAAKLSMLLVVPFLVIFLERNNRYRTIRTRFLVWFAGTTLIVQGLALLSPSAQAMILGSPLIWRILDAAIPISERVLIYLFPLVYLLLVASAWVLGRMTVALLHAFLATAFLSIVLLSDSPVGWHVWAVPFVALCAAGDSRQLRIGVWIFWTLLVLAYVSTTPAPTFLPLDVDLDISFAPLREWLGIDRIVHDSLNHTLLVATGLVIGFRLLSRALRDNDFYQLSRRPLAIGIAGDSGSGKSTLCAALSGIFGNKSTAQISGDDYHLYDRREPLWKYVTHLDPRVNNLGAMAEDVFSLLSRREIHARHYDHERGVFTPPRKLSPRDIVIVDGLHTLLPPLLRERLDVKIFVEMDEELRQFLKIRRDTVERGRKLADVEESIRRRQNDYERFLLPQRDHADIVFRLLPGHPNWRAQVDEGGPLPELRIEVVLRRSVDPDSLARALIVYSRASVDLVPADRTDSVAFVIHCGEIVPEDIALLARLLVPELSEILTIRPVWCGGASGVMQLIVLMELAQKRQKGSER